MLNFETVKASFRDRDTTGNADTKEVCVKEPLNQLCAVLHESPRQAWSSGNDRAS